MFFFGYKTGFPAEMTPENSTRLIAEAVEILFIFGEVPECSYLWKILMVNAFEK